MWGACRYHCMLSGLMHHSVLLRRLYRALYILNWIYRYMTEAHYIQWIGEMLHDEL